MEKTIKYLNEKWWYRLLKIIYLFIFIIITLFFSSIILAENKPKKEFDTNKSYIQCDDGRKESLTQNQIYINTPTSIPQDIDKKIRLLCSYNEKNPPMLKEGEKSFGELAYKMGAIPVENNYTIIKQYKNDGNWWMFAVYLTINFIIIGCFFELFKRLFYYVICGTFKPNKQ